MKRADLAAWPLRALIAVYRYGISPFMAGSCRFHPSCSNYADEALATHGVLKGGFLGFKRICRCHPWGGAGYDPVPAVQTHVPADDIQGSKELP